MTGKNKVERSFRILVDDSSTNPQDLSGDLVPGSLTGGGLVFDQVEMTGVSEAVKNYLAGHAEAEISGDFHMNDTASTGAHTVLSGVDGGAAGTVTLRWGANGAAPVNPDPEWEGEYVLVTYSQSFSGGKAIMRAVFKPGSSTAPAWGTVS